MPQAGPSAAAAAGAAAAALLQRQQQEIPQGGDPNDPERLNWTEHQTGDGRKFYYNEKQEISTWDKPGCFLSAAERANDTKWKEYRIWDGRIFYHNTETKVSCWAVPPEIKRLRGEEVPEEFLEPAPQVTSAEKRRAFW